MIPTSTNQQAADNSPQTRNPQSQTDNSQTTPLGSDLQGAVDQTTLDRSNTTGLKVYDSPTATEPASVFNQMTVTTTPNTASSTDTNQLWFLSGGLLVVAVVLGLTWWLMERTAQRASR